MTRAWTTCFTSVGAYEIGQVYCRRCEEWVDENDKSKTKRGRNGALRHLCGGLFKTRPRNRKYRDKLNELRGIKRIE